MPSLCICLFVCLDCLLILLFSFDSVRSLAVSSSSYSSFFSAQRLFFLSLSRSLSFSLFLLPFPSVSLPPSLSLALSLLPSPSLYIFILWRILVPGISSSNRIDCLRVSLCMYIFMYMHVTMYMFVFSSRVIFVYVCRYLCVSVDTSVCV